MKVMFLILACLLMQACATSFRTPLKPEQRNTIQSTQARHVVVQDEVAPAVDVSLTNPMAAGGGLIGLMITSNIDAAKNKSRNKRSAAVIEPFWNLMLDENFRGQSSELFFESLEEHFNLDRSKSVTSPAILSKEDLIAAVGGIGKSEAYIYLVPSYLFVDGYSRLRVELRAFIYNNPTGGKLSTTPKPIYRNLFAIESDDLGVKGEEAIDLWSQDDGKLYKDTIDNSLKALRDLLVYDINNVKEECSPKVRLSLINPLNFENKAFEGKLLFTEGNFKAIRLNSGIVYAREGERNPKFKSTCK